MQSAKSAYREIMQGGWNDGIADRWPGIVVSLGCILMEFCVFGLMDAFPAYQHDISVDSSAGKPSITQISIADSINNSSNPIIGVLAGFLLPYIGGRICCLISVLASLAYLLLTSTFVKSTATLYLCFPTFGSISIAFMLPIVLSVSSGWFNKYRSLAIGMCNFGGGLGMTVVPAIIGKILVNHTWRQTMRISSAFCIIGFVGALLVRLRPGQKEEEEAEKAVYAAEAEELPATVDNIHYRLFSFREVVSTMLFQRTYIALFCTYAFYCMAFFATLYLIIPFPFQMGKGKYSSSKKITIDKAATLFTWYGPAHTIGAIIAGVTGTKFEVKYIAVISMIIAGVTSMLWSLCRGYGTFALVMVILGAANSASGVLFCTVFGIRYQGPNVGVMTGLVFLAAICGMGGAPVATHLFETTGTYTISCIFVGTCHLCCAVILLFGVPGVQNYIFYKRQQEEAYKMRGSDSEHAEQEILSEPVA